MNMNTNINTTLRRINDIKKMRALGEKNAVRMELTFPDGTKKVFSSSSAAARFLGLTPATVRSWINEGQPTRGKWKEYSAKKVSY